MRTERMRGAALLTAFVAAVLFRQPEALSQDAFEDDDAYQRAAWIGVNGPNQTHTFHEDGDEDWAFFFAAVGDPAVTVETRNLLAGTDTYVELYRADGTTRIAADDDSGIELLSSRIVWTVDVTGLYYVRVTSASAPSSGQYDLLVWHETGALDVGTLIVAVADTANAAITNAQVTLTDFQNLELPGDGSGVYTLPALPFRTYTVRIAASGFTTDSFTVTIDAPVVLRSRQLQSSGGGGGCAGRASSMPANHPRHGAGDAALLAVVALLLTLTPIPSRRREGAR